MPETDSLNIEMGITLNKLVRQLAQAEARMVRTAKKSEEAFVQANQRSERSFQRVTRGAQGMFGGITRGSRAGQFALQNTALQVQDIVVQLQAGTAASRIFAQQVPQIAGAFGPLGAILGVIAGLAIPAGAALLGLGRDAETLQTQINALTKAVDNYKAASELAASTTDELSEKFGRQGEVLRPVLLALADAQLLDAEQALQGVVEEIVEIGKANDRLNNVSLANFFDLTGLTGYIGVASDLKEEIDDLRVAMHQFENPDTNSQRVEAGQRLLSLFSSLAREQGGINEEERKFITLIGQATLEAQRLRDESTKHVPLLQAARQAVEGVTGALEAASAATESLTERAGTLSERFAEAAANIAAALQRAAGAASIQRPTAEQLLTYGSSANLPAGGLSGANAEFDQEAFRKVLKGDGGQRGGGGGAIRAAADATNELAEARQRIIDQGQQQVERLTLESQLLGKSAEEAIRLRTEYELLNAAKQAGIDVDAVSVENGQSLRQTISDQAAAIAQMTNQMDLARESGSLYQDIQTQIADGMVDAITRGGSLVDVIADIGNQLAKAALQGLLFGQGGLGGLSGGVGLLSGLGFAEGGYTGSGGKHQPAGVVHGGEYVFSKQAVDRIGVGHLDAMHRRLKGYAAGGAVAPSSAPVASGDSVKIINVLDDSLLDRYLNSPKGERLIRNRIRREQQAE